MSIALFPSSNSSLCSVSSSPSSLCSEGYFKPTSDNLDIGWQWNSYKDKSKKTIVCDFCFHPST
jgi:hypothetical protein